MCSYWKQFSWTVVLATATAFAQSPPEVPQPPDTPQTESPAPRVRVRPPKPPKAPKAPRGYAYGFTTEESGSYLGVGVRDVTHDTMGQLKLKDERGVEVISLDSDGPAAKAGVKDHDVILTYNGENVEGFEQLRRLIRETPAGRKIKLGISRAGQPVTIEATLGKREEWSSIRPNIITIPKIEIPPMNFDWDMPGFSMVQVSSRSGATVEDLTPQLGEFFGTKGGGGVLVRNVERGSPADSAGLKAGDVIVKVGSDRVANSGEWRRLMRQQKGGSIPLTILRDRREQTLSLKLPERRSSDAAFQLEFPDLPVYNTAEIEKMLNQMKPEIERASHVAMISAQHSLEQAQREMQRDVERSMRELQRELEREQRELSKQAPQ